MSKSGNQETARLSPCGAHPLRVFDKKNLNDSLQISFEEGASNAERLHITLDHHIDEIKKSDNKKKIYLTDGQRASVNLPTVFRYRFQIEQPVQVQEGDSAELIADNENYNTDIVIANQSELVISIREDLGEVINNCILSVDNTALLKKLSQKLKECDAKDSSFNHSIADAIISNSQTNNNSRKLSIKEPHTLNHLQRHALECALEKDLSYIIGPPGTGKTQVLSALLSELLSANMRVLICSNTNQAVDQVLLKLCRTLGRSAPAFEKDQIVRIGEIQQLELKEEWSSAISHEKIVEKQSLELVNKRHDHEALALALNDAINEAEAILESFDHIEQLEREKEELYGDATRAQQKQQSLEKSLQQTSKSLNEIETKIQNWQERSFILKPFTQSKLALEQRRKELSERKNELAEERDTRNKELAKYNDASIRLLAQIESEHIKTKQRKRSEVEEELHKDIEQREVIQKEIEAINKKLQSIPYDVLRKANIIGATLSRLYLSNKGLEEFDVVIIDEASMAPLPALYYAAGQACEKVCISGDYRQLSPIVETEQKAIYEEIGEDIFTYNGIADQLEHKAEKGNVIMLEEQYRMDNQICSLLSQPMYNGRLTTSSCRSSTYKTHFPDSLRNKVTLIDTSSLYPTASVSAGRSIFNIAHATVITSLCDYLHREKLLFDRNHLGICTPYRAHSNLLSTLIEEKGISNEIDVGTVHRYQGDEKKVMIIDLPHSTGMSHPGFFLNATKATEDAAKMFNVAVSRAQEQLFIFADVGWLEEYLPDQGIIREILFEIQKRDNVLEARELLKLNPLQQTSISPKVAQTFDGISTSCAFFDGIGAEQMLQIDLRQARKKIDLYSPFYTYSQVSSFKELFQQKIQQGISIHCHVKPIPENGSMKKDESQKTLDLLQTIGCKINTRDRMHEKIILIDNAITWIGSQNILSYSRKTREIMIRAEGEKVSSKISKLLLQSQTGLRSNKGQRRKSLSEDADPKCPKCGGEMQIRVNRKDDSKFFSCKGYPRCKSTINISS